MTTIGITHPELGARRRLQLGRLVRLVLRVLAVLACLQLSGTLAFVSEIGDAPDVAADDCCSDCPLEKDGKECPPMCPACHCTHSVLALPAALAGELRAIAPPATSLKLAPQASSAPPAPLLGALYRPPCGSLFV